MSVTPLSTRPEPEVRQALENYLRSQKVRVSKSAVLEAALRRFLLQEGFLLDDEVYSNKEIRDIKAAKNDDYVSLKDLKVRL
jgi:hypothetical protein